MPGSEFAFLQGHQTNSAYVKRRCEEIWKRFRTMWKSTAEEPATAGSSLAAGTLGLDGPGGPLGRRART